VAALKPQTQAVISLVRGDKTLEVPVTVAQRTRQASATPDEE
jgi:hypothetical protein